MPEEEGPWIEVAEKLIQVGGLELVLARNGNEQTGYTALHQAVIMSRFGMIDRLLSAGGYGLVSKDAKKLPLLFLVLMNASKSSGDRLHSWFGVMDSVEEALEELLRFGRGVIDFALHVCHTQSSKQQLGQEGNKIDSSPQYQKISFLVLEDLVDALPISLLTNYLVSQTRSIGLVDGSLMSHGIKGLSMFLYDCAIDYFPRLDRGDAFCLHRHYHRRRYRWNITMT